MPKAKKESTGKRITRKLGVAKEKVKKAAKEVVFDFYVEIISSGVEYKAGGNDLHELLKAFPAPSLFNTETNIRVTKGGKTIQKDLKVAEARRCFTGFDTTSLELLAIGISKMLP